MGTGKQTNPGCKVKEDREAVSMVLANTHSP